MTALSILLAVLLPWFAGAALWRALVGDARGAGRIAVMLGAGFFVGCTVLGIALRWYPRDAALSELFASMAWWVAALGVVLALVPAVLRRWMPRTGSTATSIPESPRASTAVRCALIGLGVTVLAFGVLLWLQAVSLPTIAWDAWNAWQAKSKSWIHADHMLPVLSPQAWLAATPGTSIAAIAAHYPDAMPRLAVWMASAAGGWNEAAVHLPWPVAWCALGLALFGYQRDAGASVLHAAVGAVFVLTLPLVLAHVALAGYVDLWLAAMLLLTLAQCERWHRTRRWQDAAGALLAAALLPALKQEGAVWLVCVAAAMALSLLPRRWRWMALGAAVLVFAVSLPFGGLSLPLPGLGWVRLGWGVAVVPGVGTLDLHWRPVLGPAFDALFLRENWNLLWYVAPCVLWFARRALSQPSLAALGWFFGFGLAFQIVLFFFTDASQWAENLTSLNRIVLQTVPAFVYWLSLVWLSAEAMRGTPRRPLPR